MQSSVGQAKISVRADDLWWLYEKNDGMHEQGLVRV